MLPKISIVIPSFNQGKYIEQTIKSIIDQSYKNVEIIIFDAGSTDGTIEVIKKYDKQISYWISEPDCGQAHAINKGLAKCNGDIFNWLNSDDFLEPGALQIIAETFSANNDVQLICGYTRCFFDQNNTTSHEYRMGVKDTVAKTITKVEMNQPGSFYKTTIVKELGGVNESLRYVFDDELWFRYLCKYGTQNISFSDKRFAQFRLHNSSKSVGEGFVLFDNEINALYLDMLMMVNAPSWLQLLLNDKHPSINYISKGIWDLTKLDRDEFIATFAVQYINTLYLNGDIKNAKQALHIAITNNKFIWNRILTSLRLKLFFYK